MDKINKTVDEMKVIAEEKLAASLDHVYKDKIKFLFRTDQVFDVNLTDDVSTCYNIRAAWWFGSLIYSINIIISSNGAKDIVNETYLQVSELSYIVKELGIDVDYNDAFFRDAYKDSIPA